MTHPSELSFEPPFEPSIERAMAYVRKVATPAIRKEIASADWGYDPEFRESLSEFLQNPVFDPDSFWDLECVELVSNGWHREAPLIFVGGVVSLACEFSPMGYEPLAGIGRLGRVTKVALEMGIDAAESMIDLVGWALLGPKLHEHWYPISFAAVSLVASTSFIATSSRPREIKKSAHPWISLEVCEDLSARVERVIDREMELHRDEVLLGQSQDARRRWLVDLDSEQQQYSEWWRLAGSLRKKIGDRLPNVRRLTDRVLADVYDGLEY